MKKNIALIYGGEGYEREISKLSASNLFSLIDKSSYNVYSVHISADGYWYISRIPIETYEKSFNDKDNLSKTFPVFINGISGFFANGDIIPIDCAIPCLHGNFGEDGCIQGALATAHIPYIGQDVYASAVTSDKIYTKLAAEHLGIPVAKWIFSDGGTPLSDIMEHAEKKIGYPMFIKPSRLGSSYGAHPVRNKTEFESLYKDAISYDKRLLIEELIEFDYELECALIDVGKRIVLPGGRIFSDGGFYDFNSKYSKSSSARTEAKTNGFSETEARITEYTNKLARLIGIRHLSRFDFFVTKSGGIIFNEINAFPGMTETSLFPKLAEGIGKKQGDFINLLINRVCSDDRRV